MARKQQSNSRVSIEGDRVKGDRVKGDKLTVEVEGHKVLGRTDKLNLADFSANSIKVYGSEVIEQRALPDYRDGLKPVHRYCLYAMYKLHINSSGGFKKSARIIGDVIGKYHPHGDQCLKEDTLVYLLNGTIETIKSLTERDAVEQWVLAYDENTSEVVPALAHSWRIGQKTKITYKITLSDNSIVECTNNHPFYSIHDYGWVKAKDLRVGDTLLGGQITPELIKSLNFLYKLTVSSIEIVEHKVEVTMYDFTVDTYANMLIPTKFHKDGSLTMLATHNSAYQALVGITGVKKQGVAKGWNSRNCNVPLVEGAGNWGDFIDNAAAYRYTECRLSKFSDLMLLDPDYMAVIDYIPNYDDSEKMPVILPAKLPVMLLNGYQSIAVGVAASCPSFTLESVIDLTKKALSKDKITAKDCAKTLKFEFPYGGNCESDLEELIPVFQGKGSASFIPSYSVDQAKKTLTFTSVCPGLMSSGTLQTFLEKLASLKSVKSVDDLTDKKGINYVVVFQRSIKDINPVVDECLNLAARTDSYDIGVTLRNSDGSASFMKTSIPKMLEMWVVWRIELELKVIRRLLLIQKDKLEYNSLLMLAVNNLDIIIASLQVKKDTVNVKIDGVVTEVNASAAYLMKHLKITFAQAMLILNLKLISLRSMEASKIKQTIMGIKQQIKTLEKDLKTPQDRIIKELDALTKATL